MTKFRLTFRATSNSGLLSSLQGAGLLVAHEEHGTDDRGGLLLRPERLPFISYPYEWVPSQLRDAALLTLELASRALASGHTLRDASAFNVQFARGRPIFIDSLSFAPRVSGDPWLAYGQFCRHFLAPLALATLVEPELIRLTGLYSDGIPLPVARRILKWRGLFRPAVLVHLHLHALADERPQRTAKESRARSVPDRQLGQTIDGLRYAIESLPWKTPRTTWIDYEGGSHYGEEDRQLKAAFVARSVTQVRPVSLWDLGANTGDLARTHLPQQGYALTVDSDLACCETSYARSRTARQSAIPLWMDLRTPSPSSGWAGEERASLMERGPADLVLALALVHHLTISGQVPLPRVVAWLGTVSRHLVIEFPGPNDPMVRHLAEQQRRSLADYHRAAFEAALEPEFAIRDRQELSGIDRTLYLLQRRSA